MTSSTLVVPGTLRSSRYPEISRSRVEALPRLKPMAATALPAAGS
jgi:hypothetical protein